MLKSKKEKLFNLEDLFLYDLKKYSDLSIDLSVGDDDFSVEYLLNKLIYSFNCFERAARNIKVKSIHKDLKLYEKEIFQILDDIDTEKYKIFVKDYFSAERLKVNLSNFEVNTLALRNDIKNSDIAISYLSILDNANMIKQNFKGFKFSQWIDRKTLFDIFNENLYIFTFYYDSIQKMVNKNMVPNTNENMWLHDIKPLDEIKLKNVIDKHFIKLNQNDFIAKILIESAGIVSKNLDFFKKELASAIGWSRQQLNDFDDLIFGFINEPITAPAYKTWSDSDSKEISDYEFSLETFSKVNPFKDEIIKELIELADEDQKSIDSNKRKEVLAVAYLMLGRPQKAAEILDEK